MHTIHEYVPTSNSRAHKLNRPAGDVIIVAPNKDNIILHKEK